MESERAQKLCEFERIIEYEFRDKSFLDEALTHSSFGKKDPDGRRIDNEKLEFIGDAYLDAIVGMMLYSKAKDSHEGVLSKARAQVVCEKTAAEVGRKLSVGEYLEIGYGEENIGGREKDSVIADATEALIGAIFIDGGYDAAVRFVETMFGGMCESAFDGSLVSDYKSMLQEEIQKISTESVIKYRVDREEGPDHDKTFFVHVEVNGRPCGFGSGKSKKEAEQKAASEVIKKGIGNVL